MTETTALIAIEDVRGGDMIATAEGVAVVAYADFDEATGLYEVKALFGRATFHTWTVIEGWSFVRAV